MAWSRSRAVLGIVAVTVVALATSANAGIVVTPDHIVSGSVTGTLVAIDVPFAPTYPLNGGPDWSGHAEADPADNGFTTRSYGIRERFGGRSPWEPDGTPYSEAYDQGTYPTGNPNVSYNFNLAASGVDIPDGSVVNSVYATWTQRGGGDGATYTYAEGANSDSLAQTHTANPTGDLVLNWTDDAATTRNGNFQRLFAGPIPVAGGDGFELTATDNLGNAAHVDAVVLDVTLPAGGGGVAGQLGILTPETLAGNNPATGVPWAAGDQYRLAFFTSATTTAEFSDIATYNAWVQGLADASTVYDIGAADGATWKVIGSTLDVDARDNTSTNPNEDGPGHAIFLLDGSTLVAIDYADLWDGDIQHIIDLTELGDVETHWPFTGTYTDGTASEGHSDSYGALGHGILTNQVGQGESGLASNWIWRTWTGAAITNELQMYALSDALTIQGGEDVIPEPATLSLLGLGALLALRRRRRGP